MKIVIGIGLIALAIWLITVLFEHFVLIVCKRQIK